MGAFLTKLLKERILEFVTSNLVKTLFCFMFDFSYDSSGIF